jgi:hypothetical protein
MVWKGKILWGYPIHTCANVASYTSDDDDDDDDDEKDVVSNLDNNK